MSVKVFLLLALVAFFSADQNYLVNFDGKPYEEHLCENI